MKEALMFAALFALATAPAEARSKAASYLIDQEIAEACDGQGGRIDPASVIERDLTGDGRADLIISHEGISCPGSGESSFCGQLCSVNVYVRRGQMLEREREMLGRGVSVGDGEVPPINLYGVDGRRGAVRWNGQTFRPAN